MFRRVARFDCVYIPISIDLSDRRVSSSRLNTFMLIKFVIRNFHVRGFVCGISIHMLRRSMRAMFVGKQQLLLGRVNTGKKTDDSVFAIVIYLVWRNLKNTHKTHRIRRRHNLNWFDCFDLNISNPGEMLWNYSRSNTIQYTLCFAFVTSIGYLI